jgi:hypothetical protein
MPEDAAREQAGTRPCQERNGRHPARAAAGTAAAGPRGDTGAIRPQPGRDSDAVRRPAARLVRRLVEAEDWRQLRLHALETLAGRLTAVGCWGQAAAAAQAAVRAEPLRESAHAALIQVHLAEGNQSEAVRQFTRYRALLHAEFGLEPTMRLRRLIQGLQPLSR